jgi:Domain of unknown function (DUF4436)
MSDGKKKRISFMGRLMIVGVIAVVGLALLFTAIIFLQGKEQASNTANVREKAPKASGYVYILSKILDADLNKETIEIEFTCLGRGDLVDKKGRFKYDMTVTSLSSGLEDHLEIPAGDTGRFSQGSMDLNGNESYYPWDRHKVNITGFATATGPNGITRDVPIRLELHASLPGLDVNCWFASRFGGTEKIMHITILRSTITTIMVCFAIVLVWILIATILTMLLSITIGGHELQMMLFAFIGTLIFAMTSFRNALPGIPPLGVLSDYLAFFWGYAIAIIGIGLLTITWYRRLPDISEKKAKRKEEEKREWEEGKGMELEETRVVEEGEETEEK